jgi:4-hydroxy-tetrahydrodipicolinate synthase
MPAADTVDVHVRVWDAWQQGDTSAAREIFNRLLPLINLSVLLETPLLKEVLVRRGVFTSTRMRQPGALQLDDHDHAELDAILENLQPLLRA